MPPAMLITYGPNDREPKRRTLRLHRDCESPGANHLISIRGQAEADSQRICCVPGKDGSAVVPTQLL